MKSRPDWTDWATQIFSNGCPNTADRVSNTMRWVFRPDTSTGCATVGSDSIEIRLGVQSVAGCVTYKSADTYFWCWIQPSHDGERVTCGGYTNLWTRHTSHLAMPSTIARRTGPPHIRGVLLPSRYGENATGHPLRHLNIGDSSNRTLVVKMLSETLDLNLYREPAPDGFSRSIRLYNVK